MARRVNPEAQKLAMAGLIEAGISAIADEGIDQVSVQSISDAAKTSRPTFYSYFGDISGLLAEIWLAKADDWLDSLLEPTKVIGSLKGSEKKLNRAMTEILAAAHRIPEVLELTEPKIESWWDKHDYKTDIEKEIAIWLMAVRIGSTITDPVDSNVHGAAFIEPILNSIDIAKYKNLKLPKPSLPPVTDPTPKTETLDSRLLQAAIEVIASAGVKSASMARVARRAQVSTGALYPRFAKVDELIEGSFELAISEIVQQNFGLLNATNFAADEFGQFVMAGLMPARKTWRNFRIEIHLGARTRPNLAKRMAKNLKATNALLATKLRPYEKTGMTDGPIPYLVHCIGIGLAVLQNAGLEISNLDHRLVSRAMIEKALRLV